MFGPNIQKLAAKKKIKDLVKALSYVDYSDGKTQKIRQEAAEALAKLGWMPQDETETSYYYLAICEWQKLKGVSAPATRLLLKHLKQLDTDYSYSHSQDIQYLASSLGELRVVEAIPLIFNHLWRQVFGRDDFYKNKNAMIHCLVSGLEMIGKDRVRPAVREYIEKGFTQSGMSELFPVPAMVFAGPSGDTLRSNSAIFLSNLGTLAFDELLDAFIAERGSFPDQFDVDAMRIKRFSAFALGEMQDPRAVRPLIDTLKKFMGAEYREKPLWESGGISIQHAQAVRDLCAQIVHALGRIKDPAAIPSLHKCLSEENRFLWVETAKALGEIGDTSALPLLIKAYKVAGLFDRGDIKKAIIRIDPKAFLGNEVEIGKLE